MCQEECGASYISGTRKIANLRRNWQRVPVEDDNAWLSAVLANPATAIPMPVSGDMASDKLDILRHEIDNTMEGGEPIQSDRDW
jgi:hypothetical protein